MKRGLEGIRAIFFDAGGTLLDLDSSRICDLLRTELALETAIDDFHKAQGRAMLRVAELVAAGSGSTEQLKREFYLTLLPALGIAEEKLNDAVDCVLKLARAEMLWCKTAEANAAALAELKRRGLALGVVSNSDGRIESAFKSAGISEYFDFFIDSFIVGVEKPDPAIFRFAIERAGTAPHEAAYVGDLYSVDVVGARRAGLIPVLYDPHRLNTDADCLRIEAISALMELVDPD